MAEWIISDTDLGCDGAYMSYQEVIRCKDCKHRGGGDCPMYFVEEIEWDDDGYIEYDDVITDNTVDEGFCDRGEREEHG